jgi:predicted PurR-regulated permease PerM
MDYFKKNRKTFILATLWLSLGITLWLLSEILLPFILASLLAYVLEPLVSRFSKKIPRWSCVLLIYGGISVVIYLFSIFFLPELYRELLKLGKTATETVNSLRDTNLQQFADKIDSYIKYYQIPIEELDLMAVLQNTLGDVSEFVKAQSANIVVELQQVVKGVLGFLFNLMLVLMIAAFILVDPQRIKRFVFSLVAAENKEAFDAFLAKVDFGLSGVVRGQLIICVVNAILTLIGLLILNVKFALILATLAGIFSLIPIFGSIISTIPIAVVGLMTSPWTSVLAILWIAGIHALEANFLNPKILGSSAQIHPILVVLALVAGEHFYGIFGALLSVPIASILLTLFQSLLAKAHARQ